MHPCLPFARSVLAAALIVTGLAAQSETPTRSKPSLQSQIDSLKQGQEKLRRDLEELKTLLKERPARVDAPAATRPPEALTLNVFGEPFKGSPAARVAILEYSDFDCTFCARYAMEIYPLLDQAYIQAGKVKYFFRDLPGPEHPNALFKARVAHCAGEQEKFWEAHDRLFGDQSPFDGPGLARFGEALGLDPAKFEACVTSDQHLEAIRRSAQGAARMRINGTPAFLIGTLSEDGSVLRTTKVFLGAESFQAFRTILDDLLKPAEQPAP